jgi:chaperone BCS1
LYKRNYLLYGKPGTGKSSLIFALASELNYKIKIIDLKSVSSVGDILYKIADTNKTFYVFEDIDALSTSFVERGEIDTSLVKQDNKPVAETPRSLEDSKEQGLNLSDILNVLDGLYTPEGIICFFTTNHIEKLDSAFLRDGRMDYKIELGDLNKEVANQMIKDKLGYDGLFEQEFINPATLQELIIQVAWGKLTINEFKKKINRIFEK